MCVRACVCGCVRVCVRVCVCARVCVALLETVLQLVPKFEDFKVLHFFLCSSKPGEIFPDPQWPSSWAICYWAQVLVRNKCVKCRQMKLHGFALYLHRFKSLILAACFASVILCAVAYLYRNTLTHVVLHMYAAFLLQGRWACNWSALGWVKRLMEGICN